MKIFYFSSTHWDREWYQTFQGFRKRLVETTEGVCDHLEEDSEFGVFHFDGQTIVLEDIFEVRPDLAPRLETLIESRRVLIGPWYVMPDEFLVSGEALIRNLSIGHRIAREYGVEPWKFGYICDIFGHIAQMPQIFAGVGISYALLGRGTNEDTTERYFRWEAPDGSQCVTFRLRDFYGYGDFNMSVFGYGNEPIEEETFKDRARRYIEELKQATKQPVLFLMDGIDHAPIHRQTSQFLRWIRELYPDAEVYHTDLREAGEALEPHRAELQVKAGELIEPTRVVAPYSHLITNTLSSYYPLKKWNDELQATLERVVAPITALLHYSGNREYAPYEDLAWKTLLKNHPHDSIGGCSVARVHKDMEYRFAQVDDICREITDGFAEADALRRRGGIPAERYYTEAIDPDHPQMAVRVFNPLPVPRDDAVSLTVDLPAGYKPTFAEPFGYEQKPSFLLKDREGREIAYRITKIERNRVERVFNQLTRTVDRVQLTTRLELEPMGWTTMFVEPVDRPVRYLRSLLSGPRSAENEKLRLTIEANGTFTVYDKESKEEYAGLNQFAADTEIGDGWYHQSAVDNRVSYSIGSAADVSVVENTPHRATFRVRQTIRVPEELRYEGTINEAYSSVTPSSNLVDVPIETDVSISEGSPRLDVRVRVCNIAKDYRLRMVVPTGIPGGYFAYQTFAVLERPAGRGFGERTESWKELEPVEKNFASFVGKRSPSGSGLAVISAAGLHEVGTFAEADGSLYLTLLRAFRRTVMTDGEPEGQLQRELSYDMAFRILDQSCADADLFEDYQRISTPLLSYTDRRHASESAGPAERGPADRGPGAFRVSGQGVVVSTVKRPDDGSEGAVIVRVVNLSPASTTARLEFATAVEAAEAVSLLEEREDDESVTVDGSFVLRSLRPWQIATVRVAFE